jgi:hypothetical protein
MSTVATLPVAKSNPPGKTLFHKTGYSADWSGGGAAAVVAAPAAGAIYVERIVASVLAAITITISDGTTTITLAGTAEGAVYYFDYKYPVKFADTTAITVTGSGAGAAVVDIEGFVS